MSEEHTPDEIAAAEEQAQVAMAVVDLKAQAASDAPLRLTDDSYIGIVAAARRCNEGSGTEAAVQAELDRVFGAGKATAADVITSPADPKPAADDDDAKPKGRGK